MSIKKRNVSVHQIPSNISSISQIALIHALEMSVENGHPRFVLDCSRLENVGSAEMHLLLCCLETTEHAVRSYQLRSASLAPVSFETVDMDTEFAA